MHANKLGLIDRALNICRENVNRYPVLGTSDDNDTDFIALRPGSEERLKVLAGKEEKVLNELIRSMLADLWVNPDAVVKNITPSKPYHPDAADSVALWEGARPEIMAAAKQYGISVDQLFDAMIALREQHPRPSPPSASVSGSRPVLATPEF